VKTKVINFFAGPGAGKSTTAAGLFFHMKMRNYKVELVTEYAKELAYRGLLGSRLFANPYTMQETQRERMDYLRGQVEFIITDSPLIKDIAYAHHHLKTQESLNDFRDVAMKNFDSWDNFNVWVDRVKPYAAYGRRESEESARAMDDRLKDGMLNRVHMHVDGDEHAPLKVLRAVELIDGKD
jgi:AAA domain-containing protein